MVVIRHSISPIQALIIGIDKYKSKNIRNLEGAVADADAVDEYLRSELRVPGDQIVNLRNERATQKAILGQLRALSARCRVTPTGNPVPVSKGDPYIIYFAGHGTSAIAPDGWITETGKISMLVPHDGSNGKDDTRATCNIPDRTIGALLHELADGRVVGSGKGNNIVRSPFATSQFVTLMRTRR